MILSDGSTPVTLPDDLEWVDEFAWSSVKQDIQPTIGGGMVISESVVSKGRPITLTSGEQVWTNKSIVDILVTLINTVDKTYTLTLPDLREFTVAFNRESGSPITATPVFRQTIQAPDSPHILTLRLMEV